jgi:acetylornithine aminotransferase
LGHSHPKINQAIRTQIEEVMHLGTRYPNAVAEAAALDVLDIVGFEDGKCTFLSSGSESVEFMVQAVRRITGKPRLLKFSSSYLAAYGSAWGRDEAEWLLLDWVDCQGKDPGSCLEDIDFDALGGFIFEPGGSGSGFVKFPPLPLVQEIAKRIKAAEGLLAVNEITTGMGRTGKWFGFQHYDLEPDLVALGKGLGNGYPISAVAIRQQLAERLVASGLHYAQSHQNDPLGCAVAQKVIAELKDGNWVERGEQVGADFLDSLNFLVRKHDKVLAARGRGMLLALELDPRDDITVESTYLGLLDAGFLVGYYPAGNILRFDPSLTIEIGEIESLLTTLDDILGSS